MIEQKKNDWLATLFFSPDKTPQDLADYGITTDNSSLRERDYYKNIPQIQEAFKKDNGDFDDLKFNNYYNSILDLYNKAENDQLIGKLANTYQYHPDDYFAPLDAKLSDTSVKVANIQNPERRSKGFSSLRLTSAPTMSIREVGQQNKVFNWETQKFED